MSTYTTRYAYLLCHPNDGEAVDELYTHLENKGFNVILPRFDGKPRVLRRTESTMLKTSDVIILFYDSGNLAWLYSKKAEIDKMTGYHRKGAVLDRLLVAKKPLSQPEMELLDIPKQDSFVGNDYIPENLHTDSFIL